MSKFSINTFIGFSVCLFVHKKRVFSITIVSLQNMVYRWILIRAASLGDFNVIMSNFKQNPKLPIDIVFGTDYRFAVRRSTIKDLYSHPRPYETYIEFMLFIDLLFLTLISCFFIFGLKFITNSSWWKWLTYLNSIVSK